MFKTIQNPLIHEHSPDGSVSDDSRLSETLPFSFNVIPFDSAAASEEIFNNNPGQQSALVSKKKKLRLSVKFTAETSVRIIEEEQPTELFTKTEAITINFSQAPEIKARAEECIQALSTQYFPSDKIGRSFAAVLIKSSFFCITGQNKIFSPHIDKANQAAVNSLQKISLPDIISTLRSEAVSRYGKSTLSSYLFEQFLLSQISSNVSHKKSLASYQTTEQFLRAAFGHPIYHQVDEHQKKFVKILHYIFAAISDSNPEWMRWATLFNKYIDLLRIPTLKKEIVYFKQEDFDEEEKSTFEEYEKEIQLSFDKNNKTPEEILEIWDQSIFLNDFLHTLPSSTLYIKKQGILYPTYFFKSREEILNDVQNLFDYHKQKTCVICPTHAAEILSQAKELYDQTHNSEVLLFALEFVTTQDQIQCFAKIKMAIGLTLLITGALALVADILAALNVTPKLNTLNSYLAISTLGGISFLFGAYCYHTGKTARRIAVYTLQCKASEDWQQFFRPEQKETIIDPLDALEAQILQETTNSTGYASI